MLSIKQFFLSSLGLFIVSVSMAATPVEELLQKYRHQGAANVSAAAGKAFWNQRFRPANASQDRSCTSCHTSNLRQEGKHAVTGKPIKPLAPSVMSKRLTNPTKIRKWLRRNCSWTLGRECSPQEKANVLTYLKDQ